MNRLKIELYTRLQLICPTCIHIGRIREWPKVVVMTKVTAIQRGRKVDHTKRKNVISYSMKCHLINILMKYWAGYFMIQKAQLNPHS